MALNLKQIVKLLKFKYDVANKKIDAPVETLSKEDMEILFNQIIYNMHKSETIDERFFRIIDFFVENENLTINSTLISYMIHEENPRISPEMLEELEKTLCLNYEKMPELRKKAFSRVVNYDRYRIDIIKKILLSLNETEINILLQNIDLRRDDKEKFIELLIENKIKFDETLLGPEKRYELTDISKLPIEKQVEFFNEMGYSYTKDKLLEKHVELLTLEDALYFYNKFSIKSTKLDSLKYEDGLKYLYKYGKEIIESNHLESEIYVLRYFIKGFNAEEFLKYIQTANEETLSQEKKEVKNKTIKTLDILIKKEKFYKLSVEEKIQAFYDKEVLPDEVLKEIRIFGNEFLSYIPKEDLIERLSKLDSGSSVFLSEKVGEKFTNEEKYNYLKNGIIKYKNIDLIFNDIFNTNQIIELWNFNEEDAYEKLIDYLDSKMELSKEGELISEENRGLLDKILQIYEKFCNENPNKNPEEIVKRLNIYSVLRKEEIEKIRKISPQLLKNINYSNYTFEQLIDLKDSLYDSFEYNYEILYGRRRQENQEENIKYRKNAIINIIKYHPEEMDNKSNTRYNIGLLIDAEEAIEILKSLNREEKIVFLKNRHISDKIYSYIKQNNINPEEITNIIDPTKKLYNLYNTMTEEGLENVKANNIVDQDLELKNVKFLFMDSIGTILEHSEEIIELQNENPNILYTINYRLIDLLDDNNLKFFTKYKELEHLNCDNLINSKEQFNGLLRYIQDRVMYPQEFISSVMQGLSKFRKEDLEDVFESVPKDKLIYFMCKGFKEIEDVHYIRAKDVKEYFNAKKDFNQRIIDNPNSSIEQIKEAYLQQFFGLSYDDAISRVESYAQDVEILIERYKSKEDLTAEEMLEFNSLKQLLYLKEFMKFQDKELLRNSYSEFINNPQLSDVNYLEVLLQEENIRHAYTKEKLEHLYIPKNEDRIKTLDFEDSKIPVYEPNNDWNIFISVIGAYVKNENMSKTPYEEWNSREKNISQEICTSAISNENLSMAVNKKSLKFGFYKLGSHSIRKEASYDIASYSTRINVRSSRKAQFRTMQNIIDNIRTGHSEHLVERYEEYGGKRRQPDYIIAINKISKQEKKAARDFGIPIVYLDTKKIARGEMEKLSSIKESLQKNITPEDLEELVRVYHNNYSGLVTTDKKSAKKFFSPKREEMFYISLVDRINGITDIQKRLQLAKYFRGVLEQEEEKRKYTTDEFIPFKFDDIKKSLDDILKLDMSERNEKDKKNSFYESVKLNELPAILQLNITNEQNRSTRKTDINKNL